MSRLPAWLRSTGVTGVTQSASIVTLLLVLLWHPWSPAARTAGDVLVLAQLVGAISCFALAVRYARGTRRSLYLWFAVALWVALLGRAWWTAGELFAFPRSALAEAVAGTAMQLIIMAAFATALGRYRHRNWMRFEAIVDGMLLVVAVAIVVVQLDAMASWDDRVSNAVRALSITWTTLAAGNMMLVALLLVWRGEALGARLATGLTLGTVALSLANLLYGRVVLLDDDPLPRAVLALWSVAIFFGIGGVEPRPAPLPEESRESPTYASDAAKVRTFSIVAAILIASWSASALSFRGQASPALGIALALFGVLLALRAGHALLSHQRTTIVLEHAALAERELSTTLEHRVADRTRELAEAQRVLQRMWTLGQQIALDLSADRVLHRFIEAAIDVLRADGGAVGLATGDRVRVAVATGLAAPLAEGDFAAESSAMGRAMRTGVPWWSADPADVCEDDLLACADARTVAVVPLQRRGERIGAVVLVTRAARHYTDAELAHVEAMADLLSVALANADLVETLRQTEWRFRTLFRAAPDAVVTVFASGRIREANDAVREVLGLQPLQLIGRSLDEFVLPDDRPLLEEQFARALRGQPARFELRLRHEGGVRIVSLAARLLPETEPPMVLLVGRDMTSEREMRARLAETERLAAVGELVAGVAHEVNNPLSTISAFAQLLERDEALLAEQREAVEVIRSETMRASQVLRDLLTFARRSESAVLPLQLNELIERTMRLRGYELQTHGVRAEYALDPELPLVNGDGRQLQQVLLNLITNAAQAMSGQGGGTLRLTTRLERGRVVLEVSDTGPGIPVEARAHVFEPFFTTKRDGTGLGLSVSYGIVTAHGGMISIARTSSEGTTFRVSLPAYGDAGVRDADAGARRREPSPLAGARVLFVDDEATLRAGIEAFGRLRGFHATAASDGAAALACLDQGEFDVVVCDLHMPAMDGPALYEALRLQHPQLAERTVFITGDLVSADSRDFLAATTQPVLTKPFDFDRLEDALAALLGQHAGDADRTVGPTAGR